MAMEQSPGRVIVTYGRSLMALVVARSLGARGIEVVGCDSLDLTVLQFSKYVRETFVHPPWHEDPEGFLVALEIKVQHYAPEDGRPYVLIPVFEETALLAAHRDRFEPLIRIAAPARESIDKVEPKDALARTAQAIDLAIPETIIVPTPEAVIDQADDLAYPILIKPVHGVGGRGIDILDTDEALKAHIRKPPDTLTFPALLQEPVDGEDYCCAVIAENGTLRGLSAYHNVAAYPRKAGAGAVRQSVDPAPFEETARRLMAETGWNGVAQLDFRWNGSDPARLIEVNPRFWGGLFQSVQSGIDYPMALFELTVAGRLDPLEPGRGEVSTVAPALWFLSTLEEFAEQDADLERIRAAWDRAGARMADGAVFTALTQIAEDPDLRDADLGRSWTTIFSRLSDLGALPSEFSDRDDPYVALGVLFVIASVLRYGKLPPEVTYENPDRANPDDRFARGTGPARPLIGVTRPDRGAWFAFTAIRIALWLAGARTVALTASAPQEPAFLDGLVLGGGADIFPERYGGTARPGYRYDEARDDMEVSWYRAALALDMPVLGICRGVQMMNVAEGGTLHADLSHIEGGIYPSSVLRQIFFRKEIEIADGSRLHAATGRRTMAVNSIHQQAIDRLADRFEVTAREASGLIQAVEDPARSFVLGVQFHPEVLIYRASIRRLFQTFVKAGLAYASRKRRRPSPASD